MLTSWIFFVLLFSVNDLCYVTNDFSKWWIIITFCDFYIIYVSTLKYEKPQRTNVVAVIQNADSVTVVVAVSVAMSRKRYDTLIAEGIAVIAEGIAVIFSSEVILASIKIEYHFMWKINLIFRVKNAYHLQPTPSSRIINKQH